MQLPGMSPTADGPTQVRKRTQKELQPGEAPIEHVIRATCPLFTGFYLDLDQIRASLPLTPFRSPLRHPHVMLQFKAKGLKLIYVQP